MFGVIKNIHVHTDFRKDYSCTDFSYARHFGDEFDEMPIRLNSNIQLHFSLCNHPFQIFKMSPGKFQFLSLIGFDMIVGNSGEDFIRTGFRILADQLANSFVTNGIGSVFQQIGHDFSGGFAEWIRKDTANPNIRNSHAVLNPILFRGFHTDEFKTIAGQFTELAEIFWWNKGTFDQVEFIEVSNPTGILFVSLFTFDGSDILGVCKTHVHISFQIIKNRNPVLASGFHADMIAVIFN